MNELSVIFTTLFFIFPVFFYIGIRASGVELFKISIPSVLLISFFLLSYVGVLPLFYEWDEYRYLEGVQDKSLLFEILIHTSIAFMSLILALVVASYLLPYNKSAENNNEFTVLNKAGLSIVLAGLIFSTSVLALYLSKVDKIAIFTLLKEGKEAAYIARGKMGSGFPGKFGWYKVIFTDLLSLITFTLLANFIAQKRIINFGVFLVSLGLSTFVAIMTIEKAPFAHLMVGLFLTYCFVKNKGRFPIAKTVTMATLTFAVLMVFYKFFMNTGTMVESLKAVSSRVFSGGVHPPYIYLEYFPDFHDFLLGKSFPNPRGIFPFQNFNMASELQDWKYPDFVGEGIVGSMPATFWVEAYANFSVPGVIVIPFLIGFVIYLIQFFINKLKYSPVQVAMTSWAILHFVNLSSSNFSYYLADTNFVLILSFALLVLYFSNGKKIKNIFSN